MLEKTKVKKDQGTIWDFQAYAQVYRLFGGLSALAGFSYTTQERTILSVRNDQFLKAYIDAQLAAGVITKSPTPDFLKGVLTEARPFSIKIGSS